MSDTTEQTPQDGLPSDIQPISISDEMKRSYLDYAMSVIVSRALPDVRDGLKPVHRRILYSMYENGYEWNKPYRKSARIVGDVMGKYHPHGDNAIYDALVRMAQEFSLRLPLIDGQGNFGSVDGDPPAAMRYTECRLEKVTHRMLDDIDKDTVEFQENYDNSEQEPCVLPARFPNLLVNGAGGIAVGMATNIPPHNLGEVIDAVVTLIDKPDLTNDELMEIIPGPDFPTGGIILGRSGIINAYTTEEARGSVIMRGKVHTETIRNEREALIITEIPYQVNKAAMIAKIGELVIEKRVEGIAEIRDESDRSGMRVVIELKKGTVSDVVLNKLYRNSQLQTSFGANMVALNGGQPRSHQLRDFLTSFIAFREEVVSRRTRFLLNKARDRAHVLVGLAIAVANIDEVIKLIRSAPDPATARAQLMERDWPAHDVGPLINLIDDPRHIVQEDGTYKLSETQARAILDLRLQRLTALGRDEIGDELKELGDQIEDYLDILMSRARIMEIIKSDLSDIRAEFATPRRTEIIEGGDWDADDLDFIQKEDMVVTLTSGGYIKRVPLETYRAQRRGGKGRSGMSTKDDDFVTRLIATNTHTPLLFFTTKGIVYKLGVHKLPQAEPQARGKALINLLPLDEGEGIASILPLPEDEDSWNKLYVMFATSSGSVRRNKLSEFVNVHKGGKIAMKPPKGVKIISVETCTENDDLILTSKLGQCIRFPINVLRVFQSRNSVGVRGIRLKDKDTVISMSVVNHFDATPEERNTYLKQSRLMRGEAEEADNENVGGPLSQERYAEMSAAEQIILTISENGLGKRTSSYEYRIAGRGGYGIKAMGVNKRTGNLVATFSVEEADQIMLVTDAGQLIRCPVDQIRIAGRTTQGVIVFRTAKDERVVSVERLSDLEFELDSEEDESVVDEAENEISDSSSNDSNETDSENNDTDQSDDDPSNQDSDETE